MLADAEARARIRHDLDATLVVEAAAGTGKTTELVSASCRSCAAGQATLATHRRRDLHREGRRRDEAPPPHRARAARASRRGTTPERASALRRRARRARGRAHRHHPRVLRRPAARAAGRGRDRSALRGRRRRRAGAPLRARLRALVPSGARPTAEGVRRMLRRRSRDRDASGPRDALRGAGATLVEQRDFDAPWRRDPIDRERGDRRACSQLDRARALTSPQPTAKTTSSPKNLDA